MSARERVNLLTQQIPEEKLSQFYFFALRFLQELDEETDDAFCEQLCMKFEKNPDPEKWTETPIETLAAELGVRLE